MATANNQPVPEGDGPFLGVDWTDGYRRQDFGRGALPSLLGRGGRPGAAEERGLRAVARVRGLVLGASAQSDDARTALELLGGWDGLVAVESAGAAVFELFESKMSRGIAQVKAPRSWA